MKPLTLISALAMVCACVRAADEAPAAVRFSNNDQIPGSLDALSADLLVWNSPALEKPTPFFLKHVMDLTLSPSLGDSGDATHEATLKLSNGDLVRGQLASFSDESVTLDTSFAGRLNFNRRMVAGLQISGNSSLVYRGPSSLSGWKSSGSKPVWRYHRMAFISDGVGSLARDELLPEECSITFDLAWKSDTFGFKLVFFSDDPSSESPMSGYEISFQRNSIYLRNCKTQNFLGSTMAQALAEIDKAHIEIRSSMKSGMICLYINDQLIEVWSDPDVAKGKFGRCLHWVAANPSPLRISSIRIDPWDAQVERMPAPRVGMMHFNQRGLNPNPKPEAPEKPKEGRMELANGDTVEGEMMAIHEGIITVKTPMGEFKLPVERLRSIALKKSDLERAILRNGDIRAWCPDGSSLVFRLDAVDHDTLGGSSQNFSSATFKLAAFNRIEFNIHDPALEDKRSSDDW
jgi:hypothetical protein